MSDFINRFQINSILEAMHTRRVLLLNGPRQCGKTTLANHIGKNIGKEKVIYRTLDDVGLSKAAENDPHGFVKHSEGIMIIDEIQRVPSLLPAIKKSVDEHTHSGQFLLTGSANINALPSVNESLAGRVQKIRLRTLTQAEIMGTKAHFLERAFSQHFSSGSFYEDKEQILEYCFRGGYPEAIKLSPKARNLWHQDYIEALLERDLKEIARIHRYDAMQDLFKVLCSWSGKFLDISAIGTHLSIRRQTLESYMNALEILYLIERIPSWIKTDYQRVGRRPKLFVTDCGLICSLLRWRQDQVLLDSDRSGKIIESFVYNELATQIDVSQGLYNLYHFRDRENREIDFLIERDDGTLLGIEIKAGSGINMHDFKHLSWFQNNLAQNKNFIGIVLYTGEHAVPFGPSLWAVPLASIWEKA